MNDCPVYSMRCIYSESFVSIVFQLLPSLEGTYPEKAMMQKRMEPMEGITSKSNCIDTCQYVWSS